MAEPQNTDRSSRARGGSGWGRVLLAGVVGLAVVALLVMFTLLPPGPEPAPEAETPQGPRISPGKPVTFRAGDQWGGGAVTGLASGPGGTVYARTDAGGAFRWDGDDQAWVQVMTPSAVEARPAASSVLSLAASPTDRSSLMAAVGEGENSGLIRSTDGGRSWRPVGEPMYVHGNDEDRHGGSRLTHWAHEGGVFVYGSQQNGLLLVRPDDTVTPLRIPGVDPGADLGATAALGSDLWVGANGVGLFRTTDGTSYRNILPVGGQDQFMKLMPTSEGAFALVTDGSGTQRLLAPGPDGPRTLAGGWQSAAAADVSPDGRRIIVIDAGNKARDVYVSTDGGTSWTMSAAEFSGLGRSWARILPEENWLTVSDVAWDPRNPGKARLSEGSGVFEIEGLNRDEVTYRWASAGIRELVTNDLAPTSQGILQLSWDRPVFLDQGSGGVGQVMTERFNSAWAAATAPNNDTVVAAIVDDRREGSYVDADGHAQQSSLSFDGGLTWTLFPSLADGTHPAELRFGTVAVGSTPNPTLLWEASDDGGIWRSTDQGATWEKVTTEPTGHFAYWINRHTLVADPNTPGTFWSYQPDGLKVSTDDGRTWTPVATSTPLPEHATKWHARMSAVPGRPGTLLLSSGPLDESAPLHWLTTDGGATWTELSGISANYVATLVVSDTVYLVQVDPTTGDVSYSLDLGSEWTLLPEAKLPPQPSPASDVALRHDPRTGRTQLAVSYSGNTAQSTTIELPRRGWPFGG